MSSSSSSYRSSAMAAPTAAAAGARSRSSIRLSGSSRGSGDGENGEGVGRKRSLDEQNESDAGQDEEQSPNFESTTNGESPSFLFENIAKPVIEAAKLKVSEKEEQKFRGISSDAQNCCIKAVARLFLFKGTKQETVTRKNVSDVLAAIDAEYKSHVNAVVEKAQRVLSDTWGYCILSGESLGEDANGVEAKKDCYYLVSSVPSVALKQFLAQRPSAECAYAGFKMLVFCTLVSNPNHFASCEDVLHMLRKVEARFPETLHSRSLPAGVPVLELQQDFVGLLRRMQKEHYIILSKDDIDESKKLVHYGPRFFAEIGTAKLLAAFLELSSLRA